MTAGPVTEQCPTCGAPLQLDMTGRCQSCRAPVRAAVPPGAGFQGPRVHLVPDRLDYYDVAPFVELTISTLKLLSSEDSVQQYLSVEPGASRTIPMLAAAVAGAGARVRDSGQMHDFLDSRLKLFTAEEIWMFNLAIDVVAMLATAGGLRPDTRALVISDLRSLTEETNSHHWKSQVHKAGDGPAAYRALRAHVPPHSKHRW